jgi:tetratricopeptide (TPR) repeat protein
MTRKISCHYLLREEVSVDRSYDTWYGLVKVRLKMFGTEVLYLISDRAKALVKLAHTGLSCLSIPDLFHLSHDPAKGYALVILGRLRQAHQALEQAKQRFEALQACPPDWEQAQQAQAAVEACEASVKHWQGVRSAWRQHLSNLSRIMHPWRLVDSSRQTSQEVERQLHAELQALETLLETNGLPVKKGTLDKVRKQLAGVSALVDFWWQTVRQDLAQMAMTPRWTQWVEEVLLPLMYWQEQLRRTRCPAQKAQIAQALQAVQEAFEQHPCTGQLKPEVLAGWTSWASEHASTFQRASSAVEGRNGYLSQMQHNHRGLPMRRYQVWTALHNFDCRAADGTTPASRFFRRAFPDLFESVLSQVDELPRPRQRHQALAASH